MASIQQKGNAFYCQFCFQGKRYTITVGKVPRREAETFAGKVDYLLMRIKQRLITVPPGIHITDYLLCDGNVPNTEQAVTDSITFRMFYQKYTETHSDGAMEENSLVTVQMHLKHFQKTLGEGFPLRELTSAHLQKHINARRKRKYRGNPLSPVTLKKEIASFRAAWNWAVNMGMIEGAFPNQGLVYPKRDEKPPFQTWTEIEQRIANGKLSTQEMNDLWDCLFLTQDEIDDFLSHVKATANHGWIYPAVCFATHTGARRSEVLRVQIQDLDLNAGTVLVREKKRSREQRTTRRIPLSPLLKRVLTEWLKVHPGGQYLFCNGEVVARSRKRSKTTGHKGEKNRASTLKGRLANVKQRKNKSVESLTRNEAHDHFQRVIRGSKWEVMKGWHVLRHSFISNCAAKGVDQRLIDDWVGHTTEEMRKRYRHLIPSVEREVIRSVFTDPEE